MDIQAGVNPPATLASNPQRLLAALLGNSVYGYGPMTVTAADYNLNTYDRVGAGHINDATTHYKQMQQFLGASDRWIQESGPTQELLTVAQTWGRGESAKKMRALIINQLKDPSTSTHFRVLPLHEMDDAELSGIQQQVITFGYTQPQEAAEFEPPHYISFETELYQSSGYRFNHGFRFNIELMKTEGGQALLQQFAARVVSDFITFLEQMAMCAMMMVNDRYREKKLLYFTGTRTEDQLLEKYRYRGPFTGSSWLVSKSTFAPLQKPDGWEILFEWVNDTMRARIGSPPSHVFIPPGILRDAAYDKDRTDFSKRGDLANRAVMEGSSFIESLIQTKIKGIEVVTQPTYEMRDSRVEVDQALIHPIETGQYYYLGNDDYYKHNVVQSARGVDSSAPRYECGMQDLYYLDYSTDDVTKKQQSYSELMFAALCWDEDGNLNRDIYQSLEDTEYVRGFVTREMEINITDINSLYPDPWIVKSDGGFKKVTMVGNQDVYHTSLEDTKFAINTAMNVISAKLGDKVAKHVKKLSHMMHDNYQVSPDDDGSFESFMTAIVWKNVDQSDLEDNKVIRNLKKVYLPELENIYTPDGGVSEKAFVRETSDKNQKKVLVNVPVLNSDWGPIYDVDRSFEAPRLASEVQRFYQLCFLSGLIPVFNADAAADVTAVVFYDFYSIFAASTGDALVDVFNTVNTTDVTTLDFDAIVAVSTEIRDVVTAAPSALLLDNDRVGDLALAVSRYSAAVYATNGAIAKSVRYFTPAGGNTKLLEKIRNTYYSGNTFVNIVNRLVSTFFKSYHYRRAARVADKYAAAGMDNLRKKQESHSNQLWITSQLVNYNSGKTGFTRNARFDVDPAATLESLPGTVLSQYRTGPIFWHAAMTLNDIDVPFYTFNDLQRAKLAVFHDNTGKLPGFSNFESLRCVAEQMRKRSDLCGWDRPWMKSYIKKVIKYVDSVMGFASLCLHIFNPFQSSQTQRDLDMALIFKSSILHHYVHDKKEKELSAKSVFASIILDGLARTMGMIYPTVDYPILFSFNDIQIDTTLGSTDIFRKHRFDCTFRYTDSREIIDATPYVISSVKSNYPGRNNNITRSLNYSKLAEASPIARNDYNLTKNRRIGAFLAVPAGPEAELRQFFLKMVVDRLSHSDDFAFADYFKNDDESDDGVDDAGDSSFFDEKYADQINKIITKVYEDHKSDIDKDVDSFYKSVIIAAALIKKMTTFVKDDQSSSRKPKDFKVTPKMMKSITKMAETQVERYETGFNKSFDEVDLEPDYQAYLSDLHNNFLATVTQVNMLTREHQYPVVNLGLAINGKYWREFEKKMKAKYGFQTGLGVTLSLLRPQAKKFSRFLDVTVRDNDNISLASKMLQYKELVNLGPGDRHHSDIVMMLHKNIDKSVEVVKQGGDMDSILDMLDINDHFVKRYSEICKCPVTRAVGLAYLTANPTADLMVNLEKAGIPSPMSLIAFDPYIILNMGSLVFVKGGPDLGWLGHHLAIHTTGFNSDTRITTNHLSMWAQPYIPKADLILQVPNAIFQGYVSGGSGKIVYSIAGRRDNPAVNSRYRERFSDNPDWDPARPFERCADRFVAYGGGSLRRDALPEDINILGNNHSYSSTFSLGYDLPLGLIPRTPDNTFSYPSAMVFCIATRFHDLNRNVDPQYMKPGNLRDIRNHNPSGEGGLWNVWCSSGKQWRVNPNTGEGDIEVQRGTSVLKDIGEGCGAILKGAPTSFYQKRS